MTTTAIVIDPLRSNAMSESELVLEWDANRYNALQITNRLDGAALDVSTWTWQGQIRPSSTGDPVITLDVDVTLAASGIVVLSVDAAAVADLADQVWSMGVDVTIDGNTSQIVKTNTVRFSQPVEPAP